MKDSREKAPHILNASSNLVGFCFVVLTSLKIFNKHEKSLVDEATLLVLFLFMFSCLFSFVSLSRAGNTGLKMEKLSEICFMSGLAILLLVTLFYVMGVFS